MIAKLALEQAIAQEWINQVFEDRQQAKHPRLIQEGEWQAPMPVATDTVREQTIAVKGAHQWRRIELTLHSPNNSGDSSLMFWSNLPESISAAQIANLYRRRWSIEGMLQRLDTRACRLPCRLNTCRLFQSKSGPSA